MQEYNIRLSLKHDTEAQWQIIENNFTPIDGEMIIYSPDVSHSYPRIKIGDGATLLKNLDFIDAGTINGHEVEIVQLASYAQRAATGSPDKLYIDTSTNRLYYYDNNVHQYLQLSNFELNPTTIPASQINSWNQGAITSVTIENNTLHFVNGSTPTLSYANIEVLQQVSKQSTN